MHLVSYETTNKAKEAIAQEGQIKEGLRKRKMAWIESANPDWEDLAANWD
jgi:predicted GIY-YIG superfamily endonuclease